MLRTLVVDESFHMKFGHAERALFSLCPIQQSTPRAPTSKVLTAERSSFMIRLPSGICCPWRIKEGGFFSWRAVRGSVHAAYETLGAKRSAGQRDEMQPEVTVANSLEDSAKKP